MVMLSLLVQHELAQHLDGTHLDLPSSGLPVDPLALMDTLCGSTRRVILARTALMVDTPQNDRNTGRSGAPRRSTSNYLRENTRRNIMSASVASALLLSANVDALAVELADETIVEGAVLPMFLLCL